MSLRSVVLSVVTLALVSNVRLAAADRIGDLSTKSHGVSGTLHTLDDKTLFIQGFTYDGLGPDAFFYVSTDSAMPNEGGLLLPYPAGSTSPLGSFNKKNVTLVLPEDVEASELRWFAVWCKKFSVNFGDVIFPHDLMYIDDGDNNSNNHDDDDEYNNPETHDHGHHSAGHGRRPSVALPSCMIIVAAILSPGKNIF